MLIKQNVSMRDETITGLRATKAAVQDYGSVQNVPFTQNVIKVFKKSHQLYTEHLQEAVNKNTKEGEKAKAEAQKRKFKEKKAEEGALDEKLQKLKWKRERYMMKWEK